MEQWNQGLKYKEFLHEGVYDRDHIAYCIYTMPTGTTGLHQIGIIIKTLMI